MTEQEYLRRIRELEAQVEHDRIGKQLMQKTIARSTDDSMPYDPPTPAEIESLQENINGEPLSDIIAEFEQELR